MNTSDEELRNVVHRLVCDHKIIKKEELLTSLDEDVQKLLEFIKQPWIFVPDPVPCHVTRAAETAAELLQKLLGCHFQLVWTAIGERGQHDIINMLEEFLATDSNPESKIHKELIQTCIFVAHNLLNFEEWTRLQQFVLMEKLSAQQSNKALEIIRGFPGILRFGVPGFEQDLTRAIEMFQHKLDSKEYSVKFNAAKTYATFLTYTYKDLDGWRASETVLLLPLSKFLEVIKLSVSSYADNQLLKVVRNLVQDCEPIDTRYPHELYNSILKSSLEIVRDVEIDEECRITAMQSILLLLEMSWVEIESSLRQDCYKLALHTMTEGIPEGPRLNIQFYRSNKTECLAGVAGWGVYELIDQNKYVEQFRLEIKHQLESHGSQELKSEINNILNSLDDHENHERFLGILGAIWIEVEMERNKEQNRLDEISSSKELFKVSTEYEILSYFSQVQINHLFLNY